MRYVRGEVGCAGEMESHGDLLVVRWGVAMDGSAGALRRGRGVSVVVMLWS